MRRSRLEVVGFFVGFGIARCLVASCAVFLSGLSIVWSFFFRFLRLYCLGYGSLFERIIFLCGCF